jgi:hypothetical protein
MIVDVRSVVLSIKVAVEVTSVVVPAIVVEGRQGPAFTAAARSATTLRTLEDSMMTSKNE